MNRESRKARLLEVDIYPVTCRKLSEGRNNQEVLDAVIRGGARMVQLREKELSCREFYDLAVLFKETCEKTGVLLIINDRLDIALAVGADGVHLGQDDLPLPAARKLAPELLIGASTHSLEEALRAQKEGADYVNIGPIFPTATKEGVEHFLGPDAIAAIGPHLEVPFTVMGGINGANIRQVLARGARRVAMVSAVTGASDIVGTVRSLKETIRSYSHERPSM